MDILRWLWLADICDTARAISNACTIIGISILMTCIVMYIVFTLRASHKGKDQRSKGAEVVASILRKSVVVVIISSIILVATPSSKTIYIATGIEVVSSIADKAASSEVGKKALKLLESRIDRELADTKPKAEATDNATH